jgi:hypothetical protein
MEHLAIAGNFLTAIGEVATFERPPFPTPVGDFPLHLRLSLRPLTLESLADLVVLEFPDHHSAREEAFLRYLTEPSALDVDRSFAKRLDDCRRLERHSLIALYDEVLELTEALGARDAKALFVGPPDAQVTSSTVLPIFPAAPAGARIYNVMLDPVDGLVSARAAIEQIRHEGEGSRSPEFPEGGHFLQLLALYEELSRATRSDPAFSPSRPVVADPVPAPPRGGSALPQPAGVTVVNHRLAAQVMELHDLAYGICLRLLALLFFEESSAPGFGALQHVTFFPLMTLVLRPLGDLVTTLPARRDGGPARAGPSFRVPPVVTALPHRSVSWRVLAGQLDELRDRTAAVARRPGLPAPLAARLGFMAENTWRIASDFAERADFGLTT